MSTQHPIPDSIIINEATEADIQALPRRLNLMDSMMLNIGSIIGSGIFFVPGSIALYLQGTAHYLAVWLIGGVVSLLGALSIAELGAAMPHAGGQYVYLREAYGPVLGFLCGWTSFAVIMTASIAAVGVACANCLGSFIPMNPWEVKLVAIGTIWLLTAINCKGIEWGTWVQNVMTFLKVGALFALIILGFTMSGGSLGHFHDPVGLTAPHNWFSAYGLALVAVLWAYDGWIQVTYVAGEVHEPQHNLPKALLFSTLAVTALYFLLNVVFVYLLSTAKIAHTAMAASDAARVILGPVGLIAISLAILISTFGTNNGFILSGARIYYAMAKDNAFFPWVGRLNAEGTPIVSLLVQGAWATMLTFTGSFEQLFTYVIFAAWLFYALACGAVMILRDKAPDMHRPYKAWGYPVTPICFILFALGLVANTIVTTPRDSLVGTGIILLGLPVYYYCKHLASKAAVPNPS